MLSKRSVIMYLFTCLLFIQTLFAQGTVVTDFVLCPDVGDVRWVDVYLPQGYDENDTDARYPVIYFLHGGTFTFDDYPEIITVLDEQIMAGLIEPVIMVKPDGYEGPYWGMSWWANSPVNGMFEDFLTGELIEHIDQAYNTVPEREARAIMGHSMGGFGAMMVGLKHPDLYTGIASHTGALDLECSFDQDLPRMMSENGGGGPFNPNAGVNSLVIFSQARAFSGDPDNEPYLCNLPVDDEGERIDSVWALWKANDPAYLVTQLPDSVHMPIYFDWGTSDGDFPAVNQAFQDTLQTHGIDHIAAPYAGGHMGLLPQRYPVSLAFFDSVFAASSGIPHEQSQVLPETSQISGIFPNPFNAGTNVQVRIATSGRIRLNLFDMLGRKVSEVWSGYTSTGNHRYHLDGNGLSSGTYILRLDSRSSSDTKRLILMK